MMVELLQHTSSTIEELRGRLIMVRIYGIIRRQVFSAWHAFVEEKYAKQIANATSSVRRSIELQADNISMASSQKGSLVGPESRPRSPSVSIGQVLLDHPSRSRTPSIVGSAGEASRPTSRPSSARAQLLAISNDVQAAVRQTPPRRGGSSSGLPIAPSPPSASSREALVRQLQQARDALSKSKRSEIA